MSRFGQLLVAILFLCLVINGLIFVMRMKGYSQVFVVEESDPLKKFSPTSGAISSNSRLTTGHRNKSQFTIVNPHDFKYLINRPKICEKDPELIVVVCTGVKNFKERMAVRQTWGSYANDPKHRTKLVFMLGRTRDENLQKQLVNESVKYEDVIQEDFLDSYRNLSLKSVAMLKWVQSYCSSAKYLLKADDDMYVNVPNLLTSLRKQNQEKFILGFIFIGAKPVQDKRSKWYTPKEDFNEKVYPRYTSGTSYSMSVKAVADLYKASLQIKSFWLEDIYITGLCARKAGIQQIHDGGFSYLHRSPTGCTFQKAITGHNYKTDELFKIHKELYSDPPLKC